MIISPHQTDLVSEQQTTKLREHFVTLRQVYNVFVNIVRATFPISRMKHHNEMKWQRI